MLGAREEALRFNRFAGAPARNKGDDAKGDAAAVESDLQMGSWRCRLPGRLGIRWTSRSGALAPATALASRMLSKVRPMSARDPGRASRILRLSIFLPAIKRNTERSYGGCQELFNWL
jgi:hypothetical protein